MRILIISDVHGNAVALEKIIKEERFDAVWFLGDLTDYGPEPDRTLDILRDLKPEIWVSGNHDYANAFGVDCGCGEKTHELSVYTREEISMRKLSKDDREFLKSLPLREEREIEGKKFYFVHACPKDPLYGYMFHFEPECMRNEIGREIKVDFLVYGHTHFPVLGEKEGIKYFNPGSAGQPRDGNWRVTYGIYETESGEFKHGRMEYDVHAVIEKIKALHLEKRYEDMLIHILLQGSV